LQKEFVKVLQTLPSKFAYKKKPTNLPAADVLLAFETFRRGEDSPNDVVFANFPSSTGRAGRIAADGKLQVLIPSIHPDHHQPDEMVFPYKGLVLEQLRREFVEPVNPQEVLDSGRLL